MVGTHIMRVQGTDVEVDFVSSNGETATFDLSTPDDRRWRLRIDADGTIEGRVATWVGDRLADLDDPDWLGDAAARLRPPQP